MPSLVPALEGAHFRGPLLGGSTTCSVSYPYDLQYVCTSIRVENKGLCWRRSSCIGIRLRPYEKYPARTPKIKSDVRIRTENYMNRCILRKRCIRGVLPNKPNCTNIISVNVIKNAFYKSLNFKCFLKMFFCCYCHKPVAIACSITKLLTHSSMFKKLS
jgi:hypothetical protein